MGAHSAKERQKWLDKYPELWSLRYNWDHTRIGASRVGGMEHFYNVVAGEGDLWVKGNYPTGQPFFTQVGTRTSNRCYVAGMYSTLRDIPQGVDYMVLANEKWNFYVLEGFVYILKEPVTMTWGALVRDLLLKIHNLRVSAFAATYDALPD